MRTRKAILNTLSDIFLQLCTIAYGFIITRLIIEHYGSSANGLVSSVSQILGQFRIVEMGLGGAIIYSLYSPLSTGNKNEISGIASAGKMAYLRVGKYFTVLVGIMAVSYPLVVSVDILSSVAVGILILVMGCSTCLVFFLLSKYNVLFMASQKNYIISCSRVIYTLINLLLMYAYITNELNLIIVYTSSLVATITQYAFIKFMFNREFKYIDFSANPDQKATEKRYDVMTHQISGMIIFNMPVLLLTLFSSLVEVSVYSVYMMVFSGINMFLSVFNNGLVAGFGNIIAQKDKNKLKTIYSQYEYLYYIITSIVYMSAIVLLEPFMSIYTSNINDANYTNFFIGLLFVTVGVLNNWKMPQSTMITAAGHFKETKHRAIIEAVLTLLLGLILVHSYGVFGVLIASIVGLIYRVIDIFYIKNIVGGVLLKTLYRLLRLLVFVSIAAFVTKYLRNIYMPANFGSWIIYSLIIVLITSVLVFLINLLLEKNVMYSLISRFKKLIIKRG